MVETGRVALMPITWVTGTSPTGGSARATVRDKPRPIRSAANAARRIEFRMITPRATTRQIAETLGKEISSGMPGREQSRTWLSANNKLFPAGRPASGIAC
jgi:hypothetical protein